MRLLKLPLAFFLFINIIWSQSTKKDFNNKPNIVFIMADDLGYNHLGVYGQEKIKTPNIDKLASNGMRFTQFYSGASVCGPSRSSLMTGLHTGHIPYRNNGDTQLVDNYEPIGEIKTLGELFKENGYNTGYFGKYGLGGKGHIETSQKPNDRGFDEFCGLLSHGHGHFHFPKYVWNNKEKITLNNEVRYYEGSPFGKSSLNQNERNEHTDDVFTTKAIEFIRNQAKEDSPFFCFLSFSLPHTEMLPTEKFAKEYRKLGWEEYNSKDNGYHVPVNTPRANFAGMISQVDYLTGKVIMELEKMGLTENTIVIFTSDNGGQLRETWGDAPSIFFKANGVLRKGKTWNYEGGIRVPLIVKWPNKIDENSINSHIGYFADFLPTFTELIGGNTTNRTDGISFVPSILGENIKQNKHEFLYWELPVYTKINNVSKIHPTKLRQAVRFGKWKAIREEINKGVELYDLENDIGEKINLANKYPEIVNKSIRFMDESHIEPLN